MKNQEHALYQERDCHVIFYIEDSLSSVSNALCDKLEQAVQKGLPEKKKRTLLESLQAVYLLLCESCESVALYEGGGYDFDDQRVSFVIPMQRFMARIVLRLLRFFVLFNYYVILFGVFWVFLCLYVSFGFIFCQFNDLSTCFLILLPFLLFCAFNVLCTFCWFIF